MAIEMDGAAIWQFLEEAFPQAVAAGFAIDEVTEEGVMLSLVARQRHLRPGDTVSGPTLMMLADTATYLAILSKTGPMALAVTTSLEMHFLRKAPASTLRCQGRLLKLGRRLAVAIAEVRSDEADGLIAYATVTYALPAAS